MTEREAERSRDRVTESSTSWSFRHFAIPLLCYWVAVLLYRAEGEAEDVAFTDSAPDSNLTAERYAGQSTARGRGLGS